jgi:hypothetical protein
MPTKSSFSAFSARPSYGRANPAFATRIEPVPQLFTAPAVSPATM